MQTKGQYAVASNFNTTSRQIEAMEKIKTLTAELIDLINEAAEIEAETASVGTKYMSVRQSEIMRCKATAITNIEQGAMWAVKAVTKPEKT